MDPEQDAQSHADGVCLLSSPSDACKVLGVNDAGREMLYLR